jgi:LPS-assembly protein
MPRALLALFLLSLPAVAAAQAAGPDMLTCRSLHHTSVEPGQHEPVPSRQVPGGPAVFHNVMSRGVVVLCDNVQVFADEIEWYDDEVIVHIRGNVLFVQPGLTIFADHADLNRVTKLGAFFDAHGTAQLNANKTDKGLFGGMEPDMSFRAERLEKTGPKTFHIVNGVVTSCLQPTPRWEFVGSAGTFTLDTRVWLKNAVLKVKGVPVFYAPIFYYPINHEDRSTGFLMPSYGTSTAGGFTLSNAFFWAIDRSRDATFYHDWLAKAGQGFGAEYRFSSSQGGGGNARLYTLDEKATATQAARRSFDFRGEMNEGLPHGLRLIAHANYFSNATTQQIYQQNVIDASQRTRSINASLTGSSRRRRYSFAVTFDQTDVYNSLTTASRRGYGPRANVSMGQKPLGKSRIYFGANAEAAYVVSQDNLDEPSTNHSLLRFDASPTVRVPLSTLSFLTVTTAASWRLTEWLESVDPASRQQRAKPIGRQIVNLQVQVVGPKFSKVWDTPKSGYSERMKHKIEPYVMLQWHSPFARSNEVVKIDGLDSIVGGSASATYGVSNSLHVRRRAVPGPGPVREIFSVEIVQTYYTNLLASAVDSQYQSAALSASSFSPVQITAIGHPVDPVAAQFRMDLDPHFRVPRTLGASGSVSMRSAQVSVGWSKRQVIPGLPDFADPNGASHFLNAAATLRRPDGHVGGTYAFNYDVRRGSLVQQRVVMYYNSQCCGLSVDYQRVDLSHLGIPNLRSNHQLGISFTLAGLGSFSNPFGSFGAK